jgi:hypothetical protein
VIVWMVSKVRKLLPCCEGSGCCAGGGGSVVGSVFGCTIWVWDMLSIVVVEGK